MAIENNLTREEARERAALIGDLDYTIELDLTQGPSGFGCETTITFSCSSPGSDSFIDLTSHHPQSIELNGKTLPVEEHFNGARISLPSLEAENTLRISSVGEFTKLGVGMYRFEDPVDKRVYVFTDLEPFDAHRVYPCFDQPDLKGVFRFRVTAPADWVVISNMAAASKPDLEDGGRWEFEPTPRMSTYITHISGGPYKSIHDRHGDIDLGLYCRESLFEYLEADAEEIFTVTKQGFDFYTDKFGYPYPFGKYDHIWVPDFNPGAMENAGAITMNERSLFRGRATDAQRLSRANTILHELAHMWFGDLVTMKWWDDLWLNEAFATYAATVAVAEATRFTGAWLEFSSLWKVWAYRQDQMPTTHPITADMPDTESVKENFDGISYAKGASVLRQLVAWAGEELFYRGLKTYFAQHEWSNTTLEDFLNSIEKACGRDLATWSKVWLQTAGFNSLEAETQIDGDTYTSVSILQTTPEEFPTLRPHRIAIGLYDTEDSGKLVRRRRIELDVTGERTEVRELAGEKVPELLLLNDDDLTFAKITFDERSLQTLREKLSDLSEPLARAMCWTALWEMMIDAKLGPDALVEIALGNLDREPDLEIASSIIRMATNAMTGYMPTDLARETLGRFSEHMWNLVESSDPENDLTFTYLKAFLDTARTSTELEKVRGLLDGSRTIEGIEIDTELRWDCVRALVISGAEGEELIDKELERDPSQEGRRQSWMARAAVPDPEVKERVWREVTEDPDMTIAQARGYSGLVSVVRPSVGGFSVFDQQEILEPYVDRYFDQLPKIWSERDHDYGVLFANGFFPRAVRTQEVLDKVDEALAANPAGPVRRVLLENQWSLRKRIAAMKQVGR